MKDRADLLNDQSEPTTEAAEWMHPIREQWHQIYNEFKTRAQALVDQHGGPNFIQIATVTSGPAPFHRLVLHMSHLGELRLEQSSKKVDSDLYPLN